MRPAQHLTVAAALALALTACGGSGTNLAGKKTPSPTPSPTESAAPAADPDVREGVLYTDPDGFTITYPKTWAMQTRVSGLEVIGFVSGASTTTFRDNVGVVIERTSIPSLTVDNYLDASLRNAGKLISGFALVHRATQDIAGVSQGILEYTGSVQGRSLHFLAVIEVKAGKAYTATFTATPDTYAVYLAKVRPVLRSLRAT